MPYGGVLFPTLVDSRRHRPARFLFLEGHSATSPSWRAHSRHGLYVSEHDRPAGAETPPRPVGRKRTGLVRYRAGQPLLHRYRVTRPALRLSFTPRSLTHQGPSASHRSSLVVLGDAAVAYPRQHLRRGDGSTRPLRCLPHSGGGHTLRCSPSRMLLPEPECRPLTPTSTQRRLHTSDGPTRAHLFQSTATALPMAQATSCNA